MQERNPSQEVKGAILRAIDFLHLHLFRILFTRTNGPSNIFTNRIDPIVGFVVTAQFQNASYFVHSAFR